MSVLDPAPLDHVGIAVADLDAACERYERLLGARVEYREVVEGQGVEVAFLDLPGDAAVELVAPLREDSPVGRFLASRGEGLHHLCYRVPDVAAALRDLAEAGAPLVDERPRRGSHGSLIAFVAPAAFGGVLVELKERSSADTGNATPATARTGPGEGNEGG